jgi:hypothetical protein
MMPKKENKLQKVRSAGKVFLYLLVGLLWKAQEVKASPAADSLLFQIDSVAYFLAFEENSNKQKAISEILKSLELVLNKDFPLKELPFEYLTTAISQDEKCRVLSGLIKLEAGGYDYFSLLHIWEGDSLYSKVLLGGVSREFSTPDLIDLRGEECFGALYYQIEPFLLKEGEKAYLLFGLNLWKEEERRKVVEAFRINNGKFDFDLPVFLNKAYAQPFNRVVLQYSTISSAGLRYDLALGKIVMDHLIAAPHPYLRSEIVMVPDGTYETYTYEQGFWHWEEMLPFDPQGTLPNPRSSPAVPRDLLGRKIRR